MKAIATVLENSPIVIIKLGGAADNYNFIPAAIRQQIILISLDVRTSKESPINWDELNFQKKIFVRQVVADDKEVKIFIERVWWGCSSILEAKKELVEKYGLQTNCKEKSRISVSPITVSEILRDNNLKGFDLLMTDLEGLDLQIIKSCEPFLDMAIACECELRFEPFYEGEPFFHEAAGYFSKKDFQLVGLRPQYWKPQSSRRALYSDGVPVYADCLFFKYPSLATKLTDQADTVRLVKSIILLSILGKKSLAAFLCEQHNELLNAELNAELKAFLNPERRHTSIVRKTKSVLWRSAKNFGKKILRHKSPFDFTCVVSPHDNV